MAATPSHLKILRTGAADTGQVDVSDLTPLIHVHVPKCAGTTLDHILLGVARACGRPGLRLTGTIYGQGFSGLGKAEARIQAERFAYPPGWLYVSGHLPYGAFPPHAASANEVTIIREPVARMVSMYQMGVKRGAWAPATPVAELIASGQLAADSMVRQLAGVLEGGAALGDAAVAAALANFQGIKYRGVIEDFDRILCAILADYKIPFIAYDRYQIGDPVEDSAYADLAAEIAPYLDLDRAFYGRAAHGGTPLPQVQSVPATEIPAAAPVLLVSPNLTGANGQPLHSAFTTAEALLDMGVR